MLNLVSGMTFYSIHICVTRGELCGTVYMLSIMGAWYFLEGGPLRPCVLFL